MKKNSSILVLLIAVGMFSFGFTEKSIFNGLKWFQNDPWKAPAEAKKLENPVEATKSSIKKGKAIYLTRCQVCHGKEGKGDGPGSKALEPKPADHTSKKVQSQTDGEIYWKISEGRGPMVGWKSIIDEKDRWHLVNYIRTLAEK